MKTVQEIRETIEDTKHHLATIKLEGWENDPDHEPPGVEEAQAWINALEWVIEDESTINEEIGDAFWSRILEEARNSDPVSHEQILQRLREALEAPVPFFQHLLNNKEKEDALKEGKAQEVQASEGPDQSPSGKN